MDEFMKTLKPVNDLMLRCPGIWITAFVLFFLVAWWDKLRSRRKE